MEIYGEYLFLENTAIGFVILYLTGKILGEPKRGKGLLTGSVACGIYGFILFIPGLPVVVVMGSKLIFSVLVCWITYEGSHLAGRARQVGVFYLVSFVMGGATVGVMYFFSIEGVAYNGSLYMGNPTVLLLTVGCGMAYIGTDFFVSGLKAAKNEEGLLALVEIVLGDQRLQLVGLVDTGNFLRDPITGKPVFLVECSAMAELLHNLDEEERNRRTRFIPFASVGREKGSLVGIRPDEIRTCLLSKDQQQTDERGKEQFVQTEGILGLYSGQFGVSQSGQHYSVLLHPAVKERGLVYHG